MLFRSLSADSCGSEFIRERAGRIAAYVSPEIPPSRINSVLQDLRNPVEPALAGRTSGHSLDILLQDTALPAEAERRAAGPTGLKANMDFPQRIRCHQGCAVAFMNSPSGSA